MDNSSTPQKEDTQAPASKLPFDNWLRQVKAILIQIRVLNPETKLCEKAWRTLYDEDFVPIKAVEEDMEIQVWPHGKPFNFSWVKHQEILKTLEQGEGMVASPCAKEHPELYTGTLCLKCNSSDWTNPNKGCPLASTGWISVEKVQEVLLKQLVPVVYKQGSYPIEAVPKTVILGLKALLGSTHKEAGEEEDEGSPYCPVCEACGHSGCCSPVVCQQKGEACCEAYLRELKLSYRVYQDLLIHIDKEPETYKELIKWHDAHADTADQVLPPSK